LVTYTAVLMCIRVIFNRFTFKHLTGSAISQPRHRYSHSLRGHQGDGQPPEAGPNSEACLQVDSHVLQLARNRSLPTS